MIYTNHLENLILDMHNRIECDELIVISGFIGPSPVEQLCGLPLRTRVVYGMYPEELVHYRLHSVFQSMHSDRHGIFYAESPVHSKLYVWRQSGRTVHALSGSANFTTRALTIPGREILTEVGSGNLDELNRYANGILADSVPCDNVNIDVSGAGELAPVFAVSNEVCDMVLYDPQTNEVPARSGLNWGNSAGNTNPGDSYIPIRTDYIRRYPNLFPPRQAGVRHPVELVWDDGRVMDGLFEASQPVDGIRFPKQISSFRDKNIIGVYLRRRLGLDPAAAVQKSDLDRYGRNYISISLLRNGVYFLDFSVPASPLPTDIQQSLF